MVTLGTEIDVPEEQLHDILKLKNHAAQGAALNQLIQENSFPIKTVLDSVDNGNLDGVYNPCKYVKNELVWENEDYPEIIWEA